MITAHNLTVKGFTEDDMKAPPAVTLTITSCISMTELDDILKPIRESFHAMGESLSFEVTFVELDL
mgnify:FL=1